MDIFLPAYQVIQGKRDAIAVTPVVPREWNGSDARVVTDHLLIQGAEVEFLLEIALNRRYGALYVFQRTTIVSKDIHVKPAAGIKDEKTQPGDKQVPHEPPHVFVGRFAIKIKKYLIYVEECFIILVGTREIINRSKDPFFLFVLVYNGIKFIGVLNSDTIWYCYLPGKRGIEQFKYRTFLQTNHHISFNKKDI